MEFAYEIKRSLKARHIRITIKDGGRVTLTLPRSISISDGERFIHSRREWILKHVSRASPVPETAHRGRKDYLAHKEAARRLVIAKLKEWAPICGVTVKKVSIRDQKTVWGSCSRRGSLSFNYKIIFLAPELQDYLIVHELSHMKEMNHSARFWALVGKCIPHYLVYRRSLRKRGPKYY